MTLGQVPKQAELCLLHRDTRWGSGACRRGRLQGAVRTVSSVPHALTGRGSRGHGDRKKGRMFWESPEACVQVLESPMFCFIACRAFVKDPAAESCRVCPDCRAHAPSHTAAESVGNHHPLTSGFSRRLLVGVALSTTVDISPYSSFFIMKAVPCHWGTLGKYQEGAGQGNRATREPQRGGSHHCSSGCGVHTLPSQLSHMQTKPPPFPSPALHLQ